MRGDGRLFVISLMLREFVLKKLEFVGEISREK
jgi:hypothetical protein